MAPGGAEMRHHENNENSIDTIYWTDNDSVKQENYR